MKINISPKYNNPYEKITAAKNSNNNNNNNISVKQQGAEVKQSATNRDVVDFSRGATSSDKKLIGLKSDIQLFVSAATPQEKLDKISRQIKDGSYYIATDDLIDSILERKI